MTPPQLPSGSALETPDRLRVLIAIEPSGPPVDVAAALHGWQQAQPQDGQAVRLDLGGTGLVLGFARAESAIGAALHLRQHCKEALRMGAHVGADAVPGATADTARRLAQRASPGEILGSEGLREQIVPGLDAEVEEVLDGPGGLPDAGAARAFRLRACADAGSDWPAFADQRPTLVMLPLRVEAGNACDPVYAELIHYGASRALAQNKAWHLISGLSSQSYRHRATPPTELRQRLRASHVLSGTVGAVGRQLHADLSLMDSHSGAVIWQERISQPALLARSPDNPFGRAIAHGVSMSIFGQPGMAAGLGELAEVESFRLLFDAMALMHRTAQADFDRSRQMLELLAQRHPQASEPQAWLAKWHVMQVARRQSPSVQGSTRAAQAATHRALAAVGDRVLALTIAGHVDAYLSRDFAAAEAQLQEALAANPNESLAWLYLSALQVYQDRPEQAADSAQLAQLLSPLDPLRYYYDSFAAHALLAAGRVPQALVLAQRSLSANPNHQPSWVVLIMARALNDQLGQAGHLARQLRQLDPQFSVAKFREFYPGSAARQGERFADALRQACVPEH